MRHPGWPHSQASPIAFSILRRIKKKRGRLGNEATPRQWSLLGSRKVINSTIVYIEHANSYLTRPYSLNFFQACNNFENNGTCVTQCPPAEVYDPNLFRTVPNPNARLAAGDLCVLQCPGEQHDQIACTKGSLWAFGYYLPLSLSFSSLPSLALFPSFHLLPFFLIRGSVWAQWKLSTSLSTKLLFKRGTVYPLWWSMPHR